MENFKQISQNIKDHIDEAEKILLICHYNPDGDALGAILAMANYLTEQEKQLTAWCFDPLPANFSWLPNSQLLTDSHLIFTKSYDLVIILDCGNYSRTKAEDLLAVLPPHIKINIDHHPSNDNFGDINLVLPQASSTTEILHRLLKDWNEDVSQNVATCLACGLVTDTGGFVNAATNYLTLETAGDLIKAGVSLNRIISITSGSQSINNLKLWGVALARLKKNNKYGLIYTWLTREDFTNCELTGDRTEGLANFLQTIKEARIILVLAETEDGFIKGSLRTTENNIDLNKLAGLLGGGGHQKAAGFRLPGRLHYDNNKLKIV